MVEAEHNNLIPVKIFDQAAQADVTIK